jgi:sigma-B regulation protein RsbU (phosphoserine phosphatase)
MMPLKSQPSTPAKVWLVDDSPLQSRMVRQLLSGHYGVAEFPTGEEMLESLSLKPAPSIVLLDWELPGVSGIEVCRFVRQRFDETALPILMLTSRSEDEDFIEGLRAGANDYLAKPFNEVELLARVRTLMRVGDQARRGQLLVEVGQALTRLTERGAVLQRCAELLVQHLEAASAHIWLADESTHSIKVEASAGLRTQFDGIDASALGAGLVARDRQALLANDLRSDPRLATWAGREEMVAFAGFPLLVAGRLLGVVAIFSRHALTVETQRALEQVSDMLSLGVERLAAEEMRKELLAREQAARTEAQRSEAELRMVIDAIPLLVSFVDRDGRYGLVNSAYEHWFGQPRDSLRGREVREVVGEQAWVQLAPFVERGLAGERFDFEQHAVPYRSGGTRDVRVSFIPHRDAAGSNDGYVAVLEDITTRHLLERERESATTRMVEVLESISDGFFALGADWRITLVNQNYERTTGKSRAETVGRVFWEVFPEANDPVSDFYQAYHRCMRERKEVQLLDYYPPLDLWTDVRAFPTADGGIAVFFRDVTAERQVEDGLKRQADFEKQLIGIVSHDLRSPLNAVLLGSTLLAKREALPPDVVRTVARIQNAARRTSVMVKDLLDFTQARLGGGIRILPVATDLGAVLKTVLDEIEATHAGRKVRLVHDGAVTGEWDPDRLAQLMQNLLTNALKYSPAESAVEIVTQASNGWVSILVHNQGPPIPPDVQASIFEPLHRGPSESGDAERSIGLGLYIVKQIVDAHAGVVEVRSDEKHGTTFTVRLPA